MRTQSLFHTITPRVGVGVLNFLTQSESESHKKDSASLAKSPFSLPFPLLFLPSSYPPFAFPFSSLPSNPARGSEGRAVISPVVYGEDPAEIKFGVF